MQHPFQELIPAEYITFVPRCNIETVEAVNYTIEPIISDFIGNELELQLLPSLFSYSLIKHAFIGVLWLWQNDPYYYESKKKIVYPHAVILTSNLRDLHYRILHCESFSNVSKFCPFNIKQINSMSNKAQKAYCNLYRYEAYKYLSENDDNLLHCKAWKYRSTFYYKVTRGWTHGSKIWGIKIKNGDFLSSDWNF